MEDSESLIWLEYRMREKVWDNKPEKNVSWVNHWSGLNCMKVSDKGKSLTGFDSEEILLGSNFEEGLQEAESGKD